jgi:rhamnopyranosyl-N-acetylglucosaminyl-diphospho-decaprenol beta-1,3/1,4-galactofuranosyltransferase
MSSGLEQRSIITSEQKTSDPIVECIVAVIVSYNRARELRVCLDAVISQSRPVDHVLVVNNGSPDGTYAMLEQDYPSIVSRMHMGVNVGGAGGFYQGMQWAMRKGATWIWLMDDDGIPDPASLEIMLAAGLQHSLTLMNPLVVCEDNAQELSFGVQLDGRTTKSVADVLERHGASGVIADQINPFNGTLINRSVIDRVGFPRREMFIWGDEVDYTRRVGESGVAFGTVIASRHRHPPSKGRRIPLGVLGTIDTMSSERIGVAARNMAYNYRMRRDFKLIMTKPIIIAIYHAYQGRLRDLFNFLIYFVDGILDTYRLTPSRRQLFEDCEHYKVYEVTQSPS